jgi:hypothetical protein
MIQTIASKVLASLNILISVFRHRPQAPEGDTFREIANTYAVPYTSIKSFYDRRLEDFAPLIRRYVEDHL